MTQCVEAMWWMIKDRLQIVIYTGHCFLLLAHCERCVPSDMRIKGTSISPTLIFD